MERKPVHDFPFPFTHWRSLDYTKWNNASNPRKISIEPRSLRLCEKRLGSNASCTRLFYAPQAQFSAQAISVMGRTASSGVKLVHGHFFPLSIKTCHESTENIRCATNLENQIPHDEDIWLAFEESSHGLLDLSKKKEVYQNSGSSSFSYYFLKQSLDFHKPGLCHITKI